MKSKIQPFKKAQAVRLLNPQTRQNCANEFVERRKTNPDLSINKFINDLIETALSVSHDYDKAAVEFVRRVNGAQ